MSFRKKIYILLALVYVNFLFASGNQSLIDLFTPVFKNLKTKYTVLTSKSTTIESIKVDSKEETIDIVMPKDFSAIPFREATVNSLYDSLKAVCPDSLKDYGIKVISNSQELSYFIPNYYREDNDIDKSRIFKQYKGVSLITPESKPSSPSAGLYGKHLAIWDSHGRYYDKTTDSWVWQRPRLFGILEGSYTSSIVIPYLLPMLENAGAICMMPRERDIQTKEVIVDNDNASSSNYEVKDTPKSIWQTDSSGFSNYQPVYYKDETPFGAGTYQAVKTKKNGQASINWIPVFPSTGEYGVYISYKTVEGSTTAAHYTVYHTGGATSFSVNQTMGGGTWIYLGKFKFKKGRNYDCGRVELTNKGDNKSIVTADAVRFGGGIGNIARAKSDTTSNSFAKCSEYPRYLEGARYWLQWAGYSDSIYNINKGKDEYKDDYMCRALWVNNLLGGSSKLPDIKGKNIPIDAVLALHTDAGISKKDEIIGSLGIYMTSNNSNYKNGLNRISSRDLCDIVQDQTVNDINAVYDCNWTKRKLNDASYYEARVPEVPTMLFELLSHQNYRDMVYGLDPVFRFVVARAIYKGILKYIATNDNSKYVVEPLPVTKFSAEFYNSQNNKVYLSWSPTIDNVEPTATPTKYIVYTSKNNNGFDNGKLVNESHAIIDISPDTIYNFKVTAVNDGGESFPSEILSVAKASANNGTVLIVNGFNRISGPANFQTESYQGFLYDLDPGVPYKNDISYTGSQYDFKKSSQFIDNSNPGNGASYGNYENSIIAGNTFNYPLIHGQALFSNGYSFISCSVKAFSENDYNMSQILFVDLIFGKQKETIRGNKAYYNVFTEPLIEKLDKYIDKGGNIFISGEYIASDAYAKDECDTTLINFIEQKLHYTWGNAHMQATGSLTSKMNENLIFASQYEYYNEPNRYRYYATSPDAIEPINGGKTAIRFQNTTSTACVMYEGKYKTIVSTIPFETLKNKKQRSEFMKTVASFFKKKENVTSVKMVNLPAKSAVSGKTYDSSKKSYKQDFQKKQ